MDLKSRARLLMQTPSIAALTNALGAWRRPKDAPGVWTVTTRADSRGRWFALYDGQRMAVFYGKGAAHSFAERMKGRTPADGLPDAVGIDVDAQVAETLAHVGLPPENSTSRQNPEAIAERKAANMPPTKTCPECFAVVHAAQRVCPHCGVASPSRKTYQPDESPTEEDHDAFISQRREAAQGYHVGARAKPDGLFWVYFRDGGVAEPIKGYTRQRNAQAAADRLNEVTP